jgi:sugar phosphate isomerase/epimerase
MGVAFDTGWAGTQGFDAADAVRDLDDLLYDVHLKDVESAGAHETCVLGDGVVDVRACLRALDDIGFDGWVTVEHEPFDRNPMPEVERSVERLREWTH